MNKRKKVLSLTFAFLFCLGMNASSQTFTMKMNKVTAKRAITELKAKSGYSFVYSTSDFNQNQTVNVNATTVGEAVRQIVKGQNVSYEIKGNNVIISRAETRPTTQQQVGDKKTVKGVVLDENGEPVIGATVKTKGSNKGVITDVDGNFSIDVPSDATLEISYLGYASQDIKVGSRSTFDIKLAPDTKQLNEVVVTALGIKKEAKALSYNVQQLKSSDVTTVKDANFMNALAGKVAGVEINSSASGVGGGVKVVMRGTKSINGNNNALYVIDGVPMPSLSGGTQPSDIFTGMGQSGDGASMVNADDIENISVLSGAAASALYGMDAANGVIMITTKKGEKGKPHLSYSNNTTFFTPFVTPEFQNTYGQSSGSMYSWGSKLATASSYNPIDFYQTGFNEGNSLTFSTGSDKSQTFVSAASTNARGIVENNGVSRYNFAIRNSLDFLGDKMHLDLSGMYMNISEKNMISEGYYFNPIVATYLFSPGDDIRKYMPYEQYDQERNFKTQYWPFGNMGLSMQNPYWVVNRDLFENHKDRFVFSGGLTWKFAKDFSLTGRAKVDNTSSLYEKKYSASTEALFAGTYGAYFRATETTRQIYSDAIVNMDKYFGDFSVNANFGASIKDEDYVYSNVGGYLGTMASTANSSLSHGFALSNVNKSTSTIEQSDYHHQVQSVFATAQVGYKSMVYLDATARNDWDSYLGNTKFKNKGFFYPSVGLSFIFTDMMPNIKGKVLSFLKLRGSYSEVGNSPIQFAPSLTYPYQNGGIATSSRYPNPNLEPERTKSWEIGLESHFWGNKLNLNVSLYDTRTTNQYFEPQLSATSGYTTIGINGGLIQNKGIEASLTLNQPLGPVQWSSTFNYTLNRNKILKLLRPTTIDSGETISLDALDVLNLGPVKVRLTEGGSIGDLYVTTLKTDEHGYIIVDYTSKQVAGVDEGKYIKVGNTSPKYSMSWRNSFAWDRFHLGVLLTGRFGGRVVSLTQGWMDAYGVSKTTADARDNGGALVNGVRIPAQSFYSTVGPSVGSWYVYKATNVRLAELSFGYDVPISKCVPWIAGLNVSFVGRNLLMLFNKAPFDPELTASTGTYFTGIDNFMMPSLRNLGFSVKMDF